LRKTDGQLANTQEASGCCFIDLGGSVDDSNSATEHRLFQQVITELVTQYAIVQFY